MQEGPLEKSAHINHWRGEHSASDVAENAPRLHRLLGVSGGHTVGRCWSLPMTIKSWDDSKRSAYQDGHLIPAAKNRADENRLTHARIHKNRYIDIDINRCIFESQIMLQEMVDPCT